MPENLTLSISEKRALTEGVADKKVRLKAGRVVWDELDADLVSATGEPKQDAKRLYVFKNMIEDRPRYEKQALKEWLEAQIEADDSDLLGDDGARSQMVMVYKEHLALL